MLQFRGSVVTSDAALSAYRELDDAVGLSVMAVETLADARTGTAATRRFSAAVVIRPPYQNSLRLTASRSLRPSSWRK
jgi:hypothetical protein